MYNQTGGCVSDKTISSMKARGASKQDITYAQETQYSMDANDVARHRAYINQYNRGDPWREPNNFIMHPDSYQFGSGHRSPQYIGQMFSTLPVGAVNIAGPQFHLHPQISPYVYFGGNPYG